MIYRALESFDFKAASRAFAEANVCWKFKTGAKAPTAVQLRALAKELLEVVIDPRLEASVCCGGLNAVRRDDGTVELHLAL